jgi:hypothetical protein
MPLLDRREAVVLIAAALGLATRACPAADDPAAAAVPMDSWWADLEKDEAEATRALLNLADRPNDAVAFLKGKMKPLMIDPEKVKALLVLLGSDEETIWMSAFEEFEYFDPRMAIDLETLMKDVTESPARQRMVEVMSGRPAESLKGKEVSIRKVGEDGFNFFDGGGSWWAEHGIERLNSTRWRNEKKKWTRAVRAIVLLEHIATPQAVAVLKDMATGHPDAVPTRVAKEALERIASRAGAGSL